MQLDAPWGYPNVFRRTFTTLVIINYLQVNCVTNGLVSNIDLPLSARPAAGMQGGNAKQHFDFDFDAVISQDCSPGVCHEAGAKISCMQPSSSPQSPQFDFVPTSNRGGIDQPP